jgi:hypothetical protein
VSQAVWWVRVFRWPPPNRGSSRPRLAHMSRRRGRPAQSGSRCPRPLGSRYRHRWLSRRSRDARGGAGAASARVRRTRTRGTRSLGDAAPASAGFLGLVRVPEHVLGGEASASARIAFDRLVLPAGHFRRRSARPAQRVRVFAAPAMAGRVVSATPAVGTTLRGPPAVGGSPLVRAGPPPFRPSLAGPNGTLFLDAAGGHLRPGSGLRAHRLVARPALRLARFGTFVLWAGALPRVASAIARSGRRRVGESWPCNRQESRSDECDRGSAITPSHNDHPPSSPLFVFTTW